MADYRITFQIEGSRLASVEKRIRETFGDLVAASVEKVESPTSRPARLAAAEANFEAAKQEVESIRDELQNWRDSLPENLQDGTKASELDAAIESLEQITEAMDGADFDVNLPGMF